MSAQDEAVQAAVTERNPVFGMALSAFPQLRKLLLRNNGLVELAMSKLATAGGNHNSQSGGEGDYASRLAKYV